MKTKEEIAEGIEQYVNYRLEQERAWLRYELIDLFPCVDIEELKEGLSELVQKLKEARKE